MSLNTIISLGHDYGQGMPAPDPAEGDRHGSLASNQRWELKYCYVSTEASLVEFVKSLLWFARVQLSGEGVRG